ncbi:hypothetical protein ETB97_007844 [Aspergillus alliaceus]|uniref:Uncharacterized protein n=1 Tax=Petromyces alliaceus TaxID=209559 RepID=A0A8H6E1R3_PETAA|nr:hypothetical protein ETB97_007844 [Aspergillus burnettii]
MRYSLPLIICTLFLPGTWANPTRPLQDAQLQKPHYPRSPQGWIGEGIEGYNELFRFGNEGDKSSTKPEVNNEKPDISPSTPTKDTGNDNPGGSGAYLGNSAYGDSGDYLGNGAYGDSGDYMGNEAYGDSGAY